jgi:hypothetical protein
VFRSLTWNVVLRFTFHFSFTSRNYITAFQNLCHDARLQDGGRDCVNAEL